MKKFNKELDELFSKTNAELVSAFSVSCEREVKGSMDVALALHLTGYENDLLMAFKKIILVGAKGQDKTCRSITGIVLQAIAEVDIMCDGAILDSLEDVRDAVALTSNVDKEAN